MSPLTGKDLSRSSAGKSLTRAGKVLTPTTAGVILFSSIAFLSRVGCITCQVLEHEVGGNLPGGFQASGVFFV